jgi:hypothetical protein
MTLPDLENNYKPVSDVGCESDESIEVAETIDFVDKAVSRC